jgi:putative oxidoreductase
MNLRRITHVDTLLLIFRIVFGGFFFYNGVNHFLRFGMMSQYARTKGVPFPAVAQDITGLVLTCGGLSIASGVYPWIGMALLGATLMSLALPLPWPLSLVP